MTSPLPYRCPKTIVSLSNDDGDSNRSSKKAIGLHWQNNNFAHASCFLYTFLCRKDYDVKMPNFTFCPGHEHKKTNFFSFPELRYSLLEFNSRKICQHLTNWTRWIKHNKVWSRASSLFKWHFHSLRLLCCLSLLMRQPLCWCRKPALSEWNLFVMD